MLPIGLGKRQPQGWRINDLIEAFKAAFGWFIISNEKVSIFSKIGIWDEQTTP